MSGLPVLSAQAKPERMKVFQLSEAEMEIILSEDELKKQHILLLSISMRTGKLECGLCHPQKTARGRKRVEICLIATNRSELLKC